MNSIKIHYPLVTCWCLIEQVMDKIQEIWKDIIGFEGYYQISSLGRVKGLDRIVPNIKPNTGYKHRHERLLRPGLDAYGYPQVSLSRSAKYTYYKVHKLVCLHFKPKSNPAHTQINHIDGDKLNNTAPNLEWCTAGENIRHAFKNKLLIVPKGEECVFSKLTEFEVRMIRKEAKTETRANLARKYKVSRPAIIAVIKRRTWKHI